MLKMMILFLGLIIPLGLPAEDNTQEFLSEVEEGYSSYIVLPGIDNDYYSLTIVKGIYNDKGTYGICFTSKNPNEYYVLIEKEDNYFEIPKINDRNDQMALALSSDAQMKIRIFDKEANEQHPNPRLDPLTYFSKATFIENDAIIGKGEGKDFTKLSPYQTIIPYYLMFIIILGSVIVVSGGILLIMFLLKKGMFNKIKRQEGVINIKDLLKEQTLDRETNGMDPDDLFSDYESNSMNTNSINTNNINTNDIQVDEKDIKQTNPLKMITDIKGYLESKGFTVDYEKMTTEEKNKVMLELMSLKNSGQIEIKDYYEETYKLWKN